MRCDDGSCAPTAAACPNSSSCNLGQIHCPDGTCAISSCGTPPTCGPAQPYLCYDGTCKDSPSNCPAAPACGYGQFAGRPFLCPDGRCEPSRVYCRAREQCPPATPVLCADGLCYARASKCPVLNSCPFGRVACPDGSCMLAAELCPRFQCPAGLPANCSTGTCAKQSADCPLLNGCPAAAPVRCRTTRACCQVGVTSCCPPEGSLRFSTGATTNVTVLSPGPPASPNFVFLNASGGELPRAQGVAGATAVRIFAAGGRPPLQLQLANLSSLHLLACPASQPYRCADGSCVAVADSASCPAPSGCPAGRPKRCPDGYCQTEAASCPQRSLFCPAAFPHRCAGGSCVTNALDCPAVHSNSRIAAAACAGNPAGPLLCDIGTCVASLDSCPLLLPCPADERRCGDGRCAARCPVTEALGGDLSTCPPLLPVRCANAADTP